MKEFLLVLIRAYQLTFASILGGHCRYQPSCSHYAASSLHLHGPLRGSVVALLRLIRCGPFGGSGFDPVPAVWQDALPQWIKLLKKRNKA